MVQTFNVNVSVSAYCERRIPNLLFVQFEQLDPADSRTILLTDGMLANVIRSDAV